MENTPGQSTEGEQGVKKESNKKMWIIIVVVVVLGLLFLNVMSSPKNVAERAVEDVVEEVGAFGIVIDDEATLPEDWPSIIPLAEDADIQYASVLDDELDGKTHTITYLTSEGADDLIDFYTTELEANEWSIELTLDTAEGRMVSAINENSFDAVAVNVAETEEGTTVMITAHSPGE